VTLLELGEIYFAWAESAKSTELYDKAERAYRTALPIYQKLAEKDLLMGDDAQAIGLIQSRMARMGQTQVQALRSHVSRKSN
jgi:hypothetical protein